MSTHPWLALCDPPFVPVHERGDGGVASGLLQISLAEHLLLKSRDPLPMDVVFAGQVAQVGALEGNLHAKQAPDKVN